MAHCSTCSSDLLMCTCPKTEAYCDQCSEDNTCAQILDSACVIYHPDNDEPSKLENLGMPNGASAEQIFEAIDDLIGNGGNVPITPVDSASINLTVSGGANHTLKAEAIVSPNTGNQLQVNNNGLFVPQSNPNYLVKVNPNDAPDYLVNQVTGGTDGVVSVSTSDVNGQVKVQPSLDIACLLQEIKNDPALLVLFCQIVETCKCFITVTNTTATFSPACPTGYSLVGGLCVASQTAAPTINETVVSACAASYSQYGAYGALVYEAGFDSDGTGSLDPTLVQAIGFGHIIPLNTPEVWSNGAQQGNHFGPINRSAVWGCSSSGTGQLGFSIPVSVPSTKQYYIGIAADDDFRLSVNGTFIVNTSGVPTTFWNDGGAKYRYWHIYPVVLTAGINYIGVTGVDTGGVSSAIAAEIYDATLAELQAAQLSTTFTSDRANFPLTSNVYSNLNVIFSTRCARQNGTSFTIGNAVCPDSSWSLDTTGGAPLVAPCQGINNNTAQWICRKTTTQPFTGYSATVVWDRIPNALSYDVEQKEIGSPEENWTASAGSPVANPATGTTTSLVINGLATNTFEFRVRTKYPTCNGGWVTTG